MEYVDIKKKSEKYHFNIGDHLMVKRNINNECVVITPDKHTPNIILPEKKLRIYGKITGTPQLSLF